MLVSVPKVGLFDGWISAAMFQKITLDNGLRVLTAPMQGTNTATALVMCGTGSDYEAKTENGISHFLEHMFFKGTKRRPTAATIHQELDRMGSASNAFTGHETTGYHVKVAKTHWHTSLDILADVYKYSLLSEEEIEREKQVIIEEIHFDRDTPARHIWDIWEKLLYGDQPAGWDIAGDEGTVRGFQRSDLVTYFEHQYVAENTSVVVAGNIDEREVVSEIKKLFSDVRTTPPLRSRPALVESQTAPAFLAEEKQTDQTHLVVGFRGYNVRHPRRWAADILATILGGSWSSRMFSRIREELGLAYSVFTGNENYSNRGCLFTYAGIAHENVERALQAILEEYKRIRSEPIPEAELARTKDFVKGRMLMSLETSDAVAGFIGGEEMLTGEPLTPDEVLAIIEALTVEDLAVAARDIIRADRLNVALLGSQARSAAIQRELDAFA